MVLERMKHIVDDQKYVQPIAEMFSRVDGIYDACPREGDQVVAQQTNAGIRRYYVLNDPFFTCLHPGY